MIRRHDAVLLSLGVALAFTTRLITNVLTRPEFVGWFNHSAYYWVQTRSLLQDGALAYEDMPLLFALYAGLAQAATWAGAPLDDAIVVASRLVMAITPALIPIVTYTLARRANDSDELGWPAWCLILASGFLPLTYANMPEILQKNMMGLLLLSLACVVVFRWLEDRRISRLIVALLLATTILLVHLGSALAALLLVTSVTLELLFGGPYRKTVLLAIPVGLFTGALFLLGIAAFYPNSLDRVFVLTTAFIPGNSLGVVAVVAGLAVWMAILWYIWRWMERNTARQKQSVSALMRISVLWAGLLMLPLWPGEIGIRLLLFVPLPLIVLLILLLSQVRGNRLLKLTSALTALVFCVTSMAEAVSNYLIYPDKHEISRELAAVKTRYRLVQDDLIITPYGVNPTANWFLETKASLLTAVRQNEFQTYDRVFVLNTLERPAPALEPGTCKNIVTEEDRYWTTRHDIPLSGYAADPEFQTFAFFELESMPGDWIFNKDGVWTGWGDCE